MRYLLITIATAIFTMASMQVYAEEYNFKPGLWETTSIMEKEGLPKEYAAMVGNPQVEQECWKRNEAPFKDEEGCKTVHKRVGANKFSYETICKSPEGLNKVKGEVTLNGTTSSGWFEAGTTNGPAGPFKMKGTFKGKYLGPCK